MGFSEKPKNQSNKKNVNELDLHVTIHSYG